ncbi:GPI anchored serine-threonine rich family protein [Candidatus Dojkabacteria bacterium]|jgi:hypothetical protein|nr:GPI anchored serine-threonine rich family protein [Candidatus Dojkabacteria bacterium]
MKKYGDLQSKRKRFSLLAVAFLLISIPLAVYSLSKIDSFDKRNQAADLTVDVDTCQITFPYVNPASIEIDKKIQINVSAKTPSEAIKQVMIMDRTGVAVFKKDFTDGRNEISETFIFSSKITGDFGLLGTLTTDIGTRPCVVADKREVILVAVNNAPTILSQIINAKPSNSIKVNDSYQYQFEATDLESDTINFAFSFTPNATWLKSTVIENGSNGKLTIKFSGTPDKPGSYLANIFIHDGYTSHLLAQTWVISVDQDKNDIPKVLVTAPATAVSISKGQKIKVSWQASDLNKITKYELFLASNPGNQDTWISIASNLSPKVGSYIFDSSDTKSGTYQFIVRATDNYSTPAAGVGFSAKVTIGKLPSTTDDGPIISQGQVTNITPSDESTIQNKTASISATLIPATGATINKASIKIVLDDLDITKDSRINEVIDGQQSLLYSPIVAYKDGLHKVTVSFEDSKTDKVEKSWTFTVTSEETSSSVFVIFGYEIAKTTVWIILGGIGAVILAIIVPWLLYLAWRGTKKEDDEIVYQSSRPQMNYPIPFTKTEIKEEKTPRPYVHHHQVPSQQFVINKPQEVVTTPIINNIEIKKEEPIPIIVETPEPVVQTPIVENIVPTVPVEPVETEEEDDFDSIAAKELEDLAEKLKKKEELLKDFVPTTDTTTTTTTTTTNTTTPPTVTTDTTSSSTLK